MPLRKTKIINLVILLVTIAVVTAFWMLYSYTANQIADTITKSDELTIEIKKEDTMSFMKHDIETGKAYQSQLYQYVLSKDGLVGFFKTLDTIVASSSVTSQVNAVGYENTAALTAVSAQLVHVNITINGTWNNVIYFLKLLENYPLETNITGVSLQKYADYTVKGGKSIPQWSSTIDFTVVQLQ